MGTDTSEDGSPLSPQARAGPPTTHTPASASQPALLTRDHRAPMHRPARHMHSPSLSSQPAHHWAAWQGAAGRGPDRGRQVPVHCSWPQGLAGGRTLLCGSQSLLLCPGSVGCPLPASPALFPALLELLHLGGCSLHPVSHWLSVRWAYSATCRAGAGHAALYVHTCSQGGPVSESPQDLRLSTAPQLGHARLCPIL